MGGNEDGWIGAQIHTLQAPCVAQHDDDAVQLPVQEHRNQSVRAEDTHTPSALCRSAWQCWTPCMRGTESNQWGLRIHTLPAPCVAQHDRDAIQLPVHTGQKPVSEGWGYTLQAPYVAQHDSVQLPVHTGQKPVSEGQGYTHTKCPVSLSMTMMPFSSLYARQKPVSEGQGYTHTRSALCRSAWRWCHSAPCMHGTETSQWGPRIHTLSTPSTRARLPCHGCTPSVSLQGSLEGRRKPRTHINLFAVNTTTSLATSTTSSSSMGVKKLAVSSSS